MATVSTALKGQHKELSDVVKNLDIYKTPFQALIGSEKVSNTLFSWTEEELAAAGDNAHAEGAEATGGSDNILIERMNYAQIFRKEVKLTGTAQATKLAGNVQKMAHQVELRSRELKRDIEKAYLSGTVMSASGVRKTSGFKAQIDASLVQPLETITEDALRVLLADLHANGGTPNVIMTTPRGKVALGKALEASRIRDIGDAQKAVAGVSTYLSDFGPLEIHSNIFCEEGDILVMDTALWKESVFRAYKLDTLAKTGDADARLLVVEKGLKCLHAKAAGAAFTGVKF